MDLTLYQANFKGCNACHQGYKGRIGIFELLLTFSTFYLIMKIVRINVNSNTINYESIDKDSKFYLLGARGLTSQIGR